MAALRSARSGVMECLLEAAATACCGEATEEFLAPADGQLGQLAYPSRWLARGGST